ncbi:MAG: 2-C-methyl-D-erythritol 2,4-cyclodiphosphate synthase [Brevinema sp.]
MRIALGYDSHRLTMGQGIMLGGVFVPCTVAIDGAHSDGDVLLHALTDALLSPFETDIGVLFPNTDPQWKNASSEIFLKKAAELCFAQYKIVNIDMLIIADTPKISPVSKSIKKNIATLLEIDESLLSLRGKTSEEASPNHIQAWCNALFENKN